MQIAGEPLALGGALIERHGDAPATRTLAGSPAFG
jgi:hypothetical protein